MKTVGEWIDQRTSERFAELWSHIKVLSVVPAIHFLTQEVARLQARADLLEQAVSGLATKQTGPDVLPIAPGLRN